MLPVCGDWKFAQYSIIGVTKASTKMLLTGNLRNSCGVHLPFRPGVVSCFGRSPERETMHRIRGLSRGWYCRTLTFSGEPFRNFFCAWGPDITKGMSCIPECSFHFDRFGNLTVDTWAPKCSQFHASYLFLHIPSPPFDSEFWHFEHLSLAMPTRFTECTDGGGIKFQILCNALKGCKVLVRPRWKSTHFRDCTNVLFETLWQVNIDRFQVLFI